MLAPSPDLFALGRAGRPFVLLDDQRQGGRAALHVDPIERFEVRSAREVPAALDRLRENATAGRWAAGYVGYEFGFGLEHRLLPLARSEDEPLLWLGLFDAPPMDVSASAILPPPDAGWTGAARPLIDRAMHMARVAEALEHIRAGDIYQANVSFQADVPTAGHPIAVYASLRARAGAGHGALVFTGSRWVLSFSPELFFTLDGGRVTARPMKGTAPRPAEPESDARAARDLRTDPKQRAENLMIVDLLRNDLSRIARPGSVEVPALYEVESYPTVHQMTSTVTAQARQDVSAADILRATFPCGSITGVPKIRAMEIIAALEGGPRGVYTGAIGSVAPDGTAAFNVAIRTLEMTGTGGVARIGLGSGIVADSDPAEEWDECLTKGRFLVDERRFDLIETMRFDPSSGIDNLDLHIARLKASAEALGFRFDRHHARNELQAATFHLALPRTLRMRLSRSGAIAIAGHAVPLAPADPVTVAVAPLPVHPGDFRLRHKTSDRAFYDDARAASGTFETMFVDPDGFLTEGSFTNLFLRVGDTLVTPPLSRGLLPGVLRQRLLDEGRAVEGDLRTRDIADGFLIGNSLRGLIAARLDDASVPGKGA